MGFSIVIKFRVFPRIVANKVKKKFKDIRLNIVFNVNLSHLLLFSLYLGTIAKKNSKFCDDRENYGLKK